MPDAGSGQRFTNKAAARYALRQMELPAAQIAGAILAINRATTSSTIELLIEGTFVIVRLVRPGFNGYQVIESTVDSSGNKEVIQMGFDDAGNMTHFDPKTPRIR